jgi:hypothetical protein
MKISVKQLMSMIKESAIAFPPDPEDDYDQVTHDESSYAITNALDAVEGAINSLDFLDDTVGNGETLRTAVNARIMTRYADSRRRFKATLVELKAALQEAQS